MIAVFHVGRPAAWGVAVLLLVLVADASGAADAAKNNDDGFRVDSSEPDDYRGTQKDVESNITDELAVKLRQFDEWTADSEEQQAAATAQDGSPPGGDGADASDGGGPQAGAEAGGSESDGDTPASGDTDAERRGSEAATVAATAASDLDPNGAASRPAQPNRPDRRAEEDDVARMIREAAEQETDPERRKALMEQYDAYLENR